MPCAVCASRASPLRAVCNQTSAPCCLCEQSKWIAVVGCTIALVALRNQESQWFAVGMIGNALLAKLLKRLFRQQRPESARGKDDYGMPSSHAQSLTFLGTYAGLSSECYPSPHLSLPGSLPVFEFAELRGILCLPASAGMLPASAVYLRLQQTNMLQQTQALRCIAVWWKGAECADNLRLPSTRMSAPFAAVLSSFSLQPVSVGLTAATAASCIFLVRCL